MLESIPALILIKASQNLHIRFTLFDFCHVHQPSFGTLYVKVLENRLCDPFLIVVLHRMKRFYISSTCIWLNIKENTADIEFLKMLMGTKKVIFKIWYMYFMRQ